MFTKLTVTFEQTWSYSDRGLMIEGERPHLQFIRFIIRSAVYEKNFNNFIWRFTD